MPPLSSILAFFAVAAIVATVRTALVAAGTHYIVRVRLHVFQAAAIAIILLLLDTLIVLVCELPMDLIPRGLLAVVASLTVFSVNVAIIHSMIRRPNNAAIGLPRAALLTLSLGAAETILLLAIFVPLFYLTTVRFQF